MKDKIILLRSTCRSGDFTRRFNCVRGICGGASEVLTMKILTLALGATLLVVFAGCNAVYAQAQTPEAVLQEFYKWYIIAVDDGGDAQPSRKGRKRMAKYVTRRLLKQIATEEDPGADTFVQTQEWDRKWASNIKVSDLVVKGARATAIVTFGSETYPRVAVTLIKAAGTWKIDRVKDATPESQTRPAISPTQQRDSL